MKVIKLVSRREYPPVLDMGLGIVYLLYILIQEEGSVVLLTNNGDNEIETGGKYGGQRIHNGRESILTRISQLH